MWKTFGRHAFTRSGGELALVQRLLNRSSPGVAPRHIGIDEAKTDEDFLALNLE
jgi:hypothetical protein